MPDWPLATARFAAAAAATIVAAAAAADALTEVKDDDDDESNDPNAADDDDSDNADAGDSPRRAASVAQSWSARMRRRWATSPLRCSMSISVRWAIRKHAPSNVEWNMGVWMC
jgi:hypothetical protein